MDVGSSAAISPLLDSITGYGYEHQSYVAIGNGLWSQLWAMWTLPLAWGFSWRYVSQRRYLFGAVLTLALTIAFHFLTAYLAGLSLDRVGPLGTPRHRSALRPSLVDRRRRTIGDPLGHAPAARRFQVGSGEPVPGRDVLDRLLRSRKILGWLVTGKIYDTGRFPIVTILVGVGLIVCLRSVPEGRAGSGHPRCVGLSLSALFWTPDARASLESCCPGNGTPVSSATSWACNSPVCSSPGSAVV